ncbi:MAG: hypothetical protein FJ109_01510 [Deltaproteobacteria bacterium]|nr:hypothetical protein [Deltaproteobacteria bacterium]
MADFREIGTLTKVLRIGRNAFSSTLDPSVAGWRVDGPEFTIRQADALAYALATEDLNPAYFAKEGAVVPPLFASRIVKDVLEQAILHPKLGMNVLRMVHAEQSLQYLVPLQVGATVMSVAVITGIREVSSGQLCDVALDVFHKGERVVAGSASLFVRGKKKPSDKKGKDKGKKEEAPEPDQVLATFSVAPGQPVRYAQASQDYNPIHRKPLVARLAGFKAPIAHGMCVMAMAAGKLVEKLGDNDPTRLERIAVRFSTPTYPGEELTLKAREKAPGRHEFILVKADGKPVLTRGEVAFRG